MTGTSNPALATHVFRHVFFAALIATAAQDAVAAAPAAGDTFVYRVINGYNKETRAQVSYRVESNDGGRIVVAVTADSAGGVQSTATEIYTADGNWLHHALSNHD